MSQEERVLQGTRRPDGTYRKPVRIRAGYKSEELGEAKAYVSKGTVVCPWAHVSIVRSCLLSFLAHHTSNMRCNLRLVDLPFARPGGADAQDVCPRYARGTA